MKKAQDDDFCFGEVKAAEVGRHPLRESRLTTLSNCVVKVKKSLGR